MRLLLLLYLNVAMFKRETMPFAGKFVKIFTKFLLVKGNEEGEQEGHVGRFLHLRRISQDFRVNLFAIFWNPKVQKVVF